MSQQPLQPGHTKEDFSGLASSDYNILEGLQSARKDLIRTLGTTTKAQMPQPAYDDWAVVTIHPDGESLASDDPMTNIEVDYHGIPSSTSLESGYSWANDAIITVEEAFKKLVEDCDTAEIPMNTLPMPTRSADSTMQFFMLLEERLLECEASGDFVTAHYWSNALDALRHLGSSLKSRSFVDEMLDKAINAAEIERQIATTAIDICQTKLPSLQRSSRLLNVQLASLVRTLATFRDKMWFMTDVRTSSRYEEAMTVALALKKMGYPSRKRRNDDSRMSKLRRFSASTTGSLFHRSEMQTMSIMKASEDHGGPNKLADGQVELTQRWLRQSSIENLCKGEERIHRFCLEIQSSVQKLVGENIVESPELWSSDLYQQEKALFEGQKSMSRSSIRSSRPASMLSDDGPPRFVNVFRQPGALSSAPQNSSATKPIRNPPILHLPNERYRSPRELSPSASHNDRAPSFSSVASSSTFWSPAHTQAYTVTSASSLRSRPSSTYHLDLKHKRRANGEQQKDVFLTNLQQTLTSLLLSDLGSPVWSCGSETDAWFSSSLGQELMQEPAMEAPVTAKRPRKARSVQSLRDETPESVRCRSKKQRRRSIGPTPSLSDPEGDLTDQAGPSQDLPISKASSFAYEQAYRRLLEKFSRHANPFVKLQALHDMRTLIIASLQKSPGSTIPHTPRNSATSPLVADRRTSFRYRPTPRTSPWAEARHEPSTAEVLNVIKSLLRDPSTRPKTLFRDLQFIAAFIPSYILNNTESGKAFLDTGLAALALKDDVCNRMIQIADEVVAREIEHRHQPSMPLMFSPSNPSSRFGMKEAAQMWIITAKEGNPVAQRELAIFYLTHPELLPRVTLPLTMPKDTFRKEMMYRRTEDSRRNEPQSMCLALHWMQLSAAGGDEVARNNLRERAEFEGMP